MTPQTTRIAPSPTGLFHLGTARTAYINYLAAKSTGGEFIIRIDDTDTDRNKNEYIDIIFDSLDWLGLDHGRVYYQSKRLDIYREVARKLLDTGKAIELNNGAVALKSSVCLPESFTDTIAGNIQITQTNREQIDGKLILLRGGDNTKFPNIIDDPKYGSPTYQFASVVDDFMMGITNVIRGVDHITNTPKQLAIYIWLTYHNIPKFTPIGGEQLKFTHLGLIFKDKKKLSKRDGAASLLWYKERGYSPEAILNWMLLLGWGLKVPRDSAGSDNKALQRAANAPINKAAAIELFTKGTLKNSPCIYDINKLNWLQKQYK